MDIRDRVDSKQGIEERAAQYFSAGNNCCQSILLAANETWNLEMNPSLIAAGYFFQHGMSSGSTCGALVGAQMALGLLNERFNTGLKNKTANALYTEFIRTMGSSECKELRRRQNLTEKIGNKGCKKITQMTARVLYEFWENIYGQEDNDIRYYSNLK